MCVSCVCVSVCVCVWCACQCVSVCACTCVCVYVCVFCVCVCVCVRVVCVCQCGVFVCLRVCQCASVSVCTLATCFKVACSSLNSELSERLRKVSMSRPSIVFVHFAVPMRIFPCEIRVAFNSPSTHTRTLTHTYTRTHACTRARTHTRTHTHTDNSVQPQIPKQVCNISSLDLTSEIYSLLISQCHDFSLNIYRDKRRDLQACVCVWFMTLYQQDTPI